MVFIPTFRYQVHNRTVSCMALALASAAACMMSAALWLRRGWQIEPDISARWPLRTRVMR
jgi:hypothetical protein